MSDAEESELPRAANPNPVQLPHCGQIAKLLCGVIQAVIASSSVSSPSGKLCLHLPRSSLAEGYSQDQPDYKVVLLSDGSDEMDSRTEWFPLGVRQGLDSYWWLQKALS